MESRSIPSKTLLTFVVSVIINSPLHAVETPAACIGGQCSGLGHAFYLPRINVLDASQQSSGRRVLLDTAIGSCSTVTKSGSSSKDFQDFNSSKAVTDFMSAGFSGNGSSGGLLGAFSLSATADMTINRSLEANDTYNSVNLNYYLLDSIVDIKRDSNCWSISNIDPQFLASFEGLPLQDPKYAAESSSWSDYRNFLESWGSHVQVKQELGSRYSMWQSMTATNNLATSVLKAKICFNLGYASASLPACGDYTTQQKVDASTKSTVEKLYASGGTKTTRDALLNRPAGQLDQASLDAFIAASAMGDQAIGFKYQPIWGLLMDIYRTQCGADGNGSKACRNFQRAVNLQAAYEGFLAYNCVKNKTAGGMFIQGIEAGVPNGNGILYYTCKQTKTGCRKDDDCSPESGGGVLGIGKWKKSFCEGHSCISSDLILGSNQFRSIVKTSEPNKAENNSDVGVNASCRNDSTGTCNLAWGGGYPERDIWDQATGNGGSGTYVSTQSVTTATLHALADGNNDPSAPAQSYILTVEVKRPRAYTKQQQKQQRQDSTEERMDQWDDGSNIFVQSEDEEPVIECGGKCIGRFAAGQEVTLVAAGRVENLKFEGWSDNLCDNAKRGKGKTCVIMMDGNKTVESYYK